MCEFLSLFQNSRCLLNICIDFTGSQFFFYICLPGEYHTYLHSFYKSLCTFAFYCCLSVFSGWSGWIAVWPIPSYDCHQHNIPRSYHHLTQLVAKWTMGTSTGAHMARWSYLAVCNPETLWVATICDKDCEAKVILVPMIMTFLLFAVAVLYYYFYKRSILRISDARFYEDFDWVNHQHRVPWEPDLRYICGLIFDL
jgi:hypothetical protein